MEPVLLGLSAAQLSVIAVGCVVAASCSLLGTFLVLRKVAMLGDAISHAVLPGIAAAFLLTGSRSPAVMVIGAAALGVVTVFCVNLLDRTRRMHEDASIGVVFPALFSVGVILISRYAGRVHIDLDCVLYGEIAYTALDVVTIGGQTWGPIALWTNGAILLADALLVVLFYKELKITSFDPLLAASLGFSPVALHYALMGAVSVTVVGAFESVGAILVVAMLIVPPATAYLLTDRLAMMLPLAVVIGVLSAVFGYLAAHWLDCSIAGAMAAVAGMLFISALLGSPRHGLLGRLTGRVLLSRRFHEQLVLLHLAPDRALPLAEIARRFNWRRGRLASVIARLEQRQLARREGDGLRLTPAGERALERAGTAALTHR